MVSANRIYRTARQTLPSIIKETGKLFGADDFDTKISLSDMTSLPGYPLTLFMYDTREECIRFPWKEASKNYSGLRKMYLRYLREFDVKDAAILELAHEVPHNAHDFITKFEIGKEMLGVISEVSKKNKIGIRYVLSRGIMEGIADYPRSLILENSGLYELNAASDKLQDSTARISLSFIGHSTVESVADYIESTPITALNSTLPIIALTGYYFKQKFKGEGLERFRDFAREWRLSHVTYEWSRKTLDDIIRYARSAKI